jgi:hypothetical protein
MRRRSILSTFVVILVLVGLSVTASASNPSSALSLVVLSTRADLVSGGEALTQVVLPNGVSSDQIHLTLNGVDVTQEFALRPGGLDEGLLTGLRVGTNTLLATRAGGTGAQLIITDHPSHGPLFSGPQIEPWTCLAGAVDQYCDTPVTYSYYYVPVGANSAQFSLGGSQLFNEAFQPYNPASPPPTALIAKTTTDKGVTVPFIIRQEQGSLDRGQYLIASLYQPGRPWQPWAPQPQWNHDVEITGGADCGVLHGEGAAPTVQDSNGLGLGFIVASTSLDHNGEDCNLVVQAESLIMLKEHIVDTYGPIQFNIGSGCSGGSILQQQVANAYPGVFNAITPQCSFPDSWSTSMEVLDCQLLLNYWNSSVTRGVVWTETQEAAVAGAQSLAPCESWINVYAFNQSANPELESGKLMNMQNCGVTASQAWSPSNPAGVRCDLEDYTVNVLGRQAGTGYANDPFDNVGIPYGLEALLGGDISPAPFADRNAAIGGINDNFDYTAARSTADLAALPILYRSGLINEANNLCELPIVDLRGHDTVEIHQDYRSYVMRSRLDAACGNHQNQIIITGPIPIVGATTFPDVGFDINNQWLTNIFSDHRDVSLRTKVDEDKPADAVDTCVDAEGTDIPCQVAGIPIYAYTENPRIVAGEPFTDDVMKCQLKPLTTSEFDPIQFTSFEWKQLEAAFPNGICNYGLPGVGQQPTVPWLTYTGGPGGVPLGPSPRSTPVPATR